MVRWLDVKRLRIISLLLLSLLSTTATVFAADEPATSLSRTSRTSGTLGEGTAWATPWFVVDAEDEGPTVVVTGGMHGDEPAGSAAAEQIRHWPIARGRLVVVPRVNRLGLAADMRWFPPSRNDRALRDLNRNFPTDDDESPRTPLCEAVWELLDDHQPNLLLDLHEGGGSV